MATTSIWRVKGWLGKVVIYVENPDKTENPAFYERQDMTDRQAQGLSDVIDYAVNSEKTQKADEATEVMQQFVSGVNCHPATAREEMIAVKKRFGKEDGTVAYHGYQSFAPGEATPEMAHEIGVKLAQQLWGDKYQVIVATHLDKESHLHNHFVVNAEQHRAGPEQSRAGTGQERASAEQRKADLPKKQAREKAADRVRRRSADTARQSVKTAGREVQTIKTVERGEKTIKTSQATAKAAQKSAQAAAKASHRAAQAARAAAKATAAGIKAAAKVTAAAVKAMITATKALIAAIAAGGWIAVAVIVIICLIGLIVASCFGIFFSGEDTGTGQTMQTVVREINEDYENQLDTIKANISYDVLEMSGSRAVWPEVLSVYAVKTTTDPDNAMDVATVDDARKAILKDIFWQMNEISSRTETSTETVIEESDDGNGNIVETTTTVTRTTLYITVSHKTAEEMADYFGFNADQRAQLAELLAEENNSLWAAVLYGIGVSDDTIVAVALSQVGNIGGQPYWSWYGFEGRVEWCACFVSWCANECGYIENGIIPKFAGCVNGVQWFKDRGQWADNSIEPTPGMIIFFDWDSPNGSSGPQDGQSDHVGIVEKCENGIVYTIEENSGDSCRQRQYSVGYYEILGYGIPAY